MIAPSRSVIGLPTPTAWATDIAISGLTPSGRALAFIAALAVFFLSPLNFETAVSLLFAAGFSTIVIVDYSRSCRPLAVRASAVPAGVAPRKERFGLAA